jgi:hypothetical protein
MQELPGESITLRLF